MKLYRLIMSDEKLDIENNFFEETNPTLISNLSGFYYKKSIKFGKYFFLFKRDVLKFIKEKCDNLKEQSISEDMIKSYTFHILEIDVEKIKILKHIGIGLYRPKSLSQLRYEPRIEVLLPTQMVKESVLGYSKIYQVKESELEKLLIDEKSDQKNVMLSDIFNDFNVSKTNSYDGESLKLNDDFVIFDDNKMIVDESSVSKKIDDSLSKN